MDTFHFSCSMTIKPWKFVFLYVQLTYLTNLGTIKAVPAGLRGLLLRAGDGKGVEGGR